MLEEQASGRNSIHDERTRDGRYFRRRFRIPFAMFMTLIQIILEEHWFSGFDEIGRGNLDATRDERRRGASLHVKVLSVLRVLGRDNVFDECFDGSGCSESSLASWLLFFWIVLSPAFSSVWFAHQQLSMNSPRRCTSINALG
jgi:hypothetical protein